MLKKILFALGIGAVGIVVVVSALIGVAWYSNHRALQAATAFCANTAVGSDIPLAVARAQRDGIRHRVSEDKKGYEFVFQGWVFNAALCRVSVANAKVVTRQSLLDGD